MDDVNLFGDFCDPHCALRNLLAYKYQNADVWAARDGRPQTLGVIGHGRGLILFSCV